MSDVAAYHVCVCALFSVQGSIAPCSLKMICYMLSKYVGAY